MARHPIAMFKAMRGTPLQLLRDQARAAKFPFIIIGLQQPDSRGAVTLASSDPSDPPRLRYNVFGEESDRRRFREAIRRLDEIFASGPMRDINASLLGLEKDDLVSDKSVDAWATNHLFVVGHPSCTCKMGPSSDPMAVVDQYGRVYGVENLRVCDTSIFPEIPSRGPNATAIMLGERMSDFIANPVSQRADTRSHREGTHVASSSTESQA